MPAKETPVEVLSNVRLGQQCNLISGLAPFWWSGEAESPLIPANAGQHLAVSKAPELTHGRWTKHQRVDLCANWSDFAREFFAAFETGGRGSAHAYALNRPDAEGIAAFAEWLGIDPSVANDRSGCGFALVRKFKHLDIQSSEGPLAGVEDLVGKAQALDGSHGAMLEHFAEYGTHLLTRIDWGDILGQVFVFDREHYDLVEESLTEDMRTGADSSFFVNFTQLRDEARKVGFVKQAGRLWLASDAAEFQTIAAASADPTNQLEQSFFTVIATRSLTKQLYAISDVTAVGFELAPILDQQPLTALEPAVEILSEGSELPLSRERTTELAEHWHLSEANGRFHLFGADGNPGFEKKQWPDYSKLYEDFTPAPVTYACTQRMSIKRPYVNLDTIEQEFPLFRDQVEDLLIVADVVQVQRKNVSLPGRKITVICRRLVCGNHGNSAPSMILRGDAYADFNLHTGEVRGTLTVSNGTEHKTIADGEVIETGDNMVSVTRRVDAPLPAEYFKTNTSWLADNLLEGLEFGLVATETLLDLSRGESRVEAWAHAIWISNLISVDAAVLGNQLDPRWTALQLRAQTALLADRAGQPPFVPPFSFAAYQPKIQALLAVIEHFEGNKRHMEEAIRADMESQRQRATEGTLNENLQAIGGFLAKQTKALSEHEQDASVAIAKVETANAETLSKLEQKSMTQLSVLSETQENFRQAQVDLDAAIQAYVVEEAIWMCIDLAVGLAEVAVNLTALADFSGKIAKTARDAVKFKKFVGIITRLEGFLKLLKTIKGVFNKTQSLVHLAGEDHGDMHRLIELYAVKDGKSVIPSDADWSDFEIELGVVTAELPKEVTSAKASFMAAAKRMSRSAKSWSATQGKIAQLKIDQVRLQWQREVSDKHQVRMHALAQTLLQKDLPQEELVQIDLFGMAAYFESRSSGFRLALARTLREYDAALHYYYLYRPEPLSRYDLGSLRTAMVDRSAAAIQGFSPDRYRPTNVEQPFVVKLPRSSVAELRSPEGLRFDVGLHFQPLLGYVRVRTLEIRVKLSGLRSPETKKYFCSMVSHNTPFYDRGIGREELEFDSIPFAFNYVHDVENDRVHTSNRISDDMMGNYNSMTPFTLWALTLPEGGDNRGVAFEGDVCDIEVEFFVNACYVGYKSKAATKITDQSKTLAGGQSGKLSKKRIAPASAPAAMMNGGGAGMSLMAAGGAAAPSSIVSASEATGTPAEALMAEMSGRAVTNGWDVACLMDIAKVNNLFAERYEKERTGAEQSLAHEIVLPEFVYTRDYEPTEEEENKANVTMVVGPPKIQLLGDGSIRASVYMDVLSGSIRKRRYERERDSEDDPWGEWEVTKDRTQEIKPDQNAIRCDVNLQKLKGRANPSLQINASDQRIVVHLGEGTFETSVSMDGPIAAIVTSELKKFFAAMESKFDYCLGVARWDLPHTPLALRPATFQFTTRVFEGSTPEDPRGVLVMLITTQSSGSKTPSRADINLDNDELLAAGKTASLIISSRLLYAEILLPKLRGKWGGTSNGHTAKLTVVAPETGKAHRIVGTGDIYAGKTIANALLHKKKERETLVPFSGFTASGYGQTLSIEWSQSWKQEFAIENNAGFGANQIESTKFTLKLSEAASLKIADRNGRPVLQVQRLNLKPSIDYEKQDWLTEALSPYLRLPDIGAVNREMKTSIENKLPAFSIDLGDLSLFAVTSLIFPNASVLKLGENDAYLPGDLWILGDVVDHYRPFSS